MNVDFCGAENKFSISLKPNHYKKSDKSQKKLLSLQAKEKKNGKKGQRADTYDEAVFRAER